MPTKEEFAVFMGYYDRLSKLDGSLSLSHPHLSAFGKAERLTFPIPECVTVYNWLMEQASNEVV